MFLRHVLTTEGEVPQWSGTMLFRRKIKVNNGACFICKMNILYNFSSNISFICWEKKKLFCKILITVLTVTGQLIYPIIREFYLPQRERAGLREREQRPNLSAGKLPYKLQQWLWIILLASVIFCMRNIIRYFLHFFVADNCQEFHCPLISPVSFFSQWVTFQLPNHVFPNYSLQMQMK